MDENIPEYIKNWRIGLRDIELLELLETTEIKNIGEKRFPPQSENAVYRNMNSLRLRIQRYRWFLNFLNNIQRRSKRVKKFTITPEPLEKLEAENI